MLTFIVFRPRPLATVLIKLTAYSNAPTLIALFYPPNIKKGIKPCDCLSGADMSAFQTQSTVPLPISQHRFLGLCLLSCRNSSMHFTLLGVGSTTKGEAILTQVLLCAIRNKATGPACCQNCLFNTKYSFSEI